MLTSKNDISIRSLENTEKDFKLLLKWLSNEKVIEHSWNENLPWTIGKVRDEFSTDDKTNKCIILYKGEEAGYIQYYPIEKDSYKFESEKDFEALKDAYGFDMFIGVPELWGKGIAKNTLLLLEEYLYKEKGVRKFTSDPEISNKNGLIFWQKAGFKPFSEVEAYDNPEEKSLIMVKEMEKKTLIFNGSPRKNGDTKSLLNILIDKLEGETKVVDCYYENISPCIDCRYCHKNKGCCIKDNMQEIYKYIEECDSIVIASPVYFSEVTGKLLDVMSRLQCYFTASRFLKDPIYIKPKKGGVILVGGGEGAPDKALSTAKMLLKCMKVNEDNIFTPVTDTFTDTRPAVNCKETVEKVKALAEFLNKE